MGTRHSKQSTAFPPRSDAPRATFFSPIREATHVKKANIAPDSPPEMPSPKPRHGPWNTRPRLPQVPQVSFKAISSSPSGHQFSSSEIQSATSSFSTEIGKGGFGTVYRGAVFDVDTRQEVPVAVKVLSNNSFQSRQEVLHEMLTVASLQHTFTLRLFGFCLNGCKALVYELMAGGDLDAFLLKCKRGEAEFPWEARLKVAQGCAEALAFMHGKRIIHRDFKSSNILLTEDLSPRVADFGLAKAMHDWRSHATTRIQGSIGYMDPAYFILGHVHSKSDVYAFGVVLMELLTGKSVVRDCIHESIIPSITRKGSTHDDGHESIISSITRKDSEGAQQRQASLFEDAVVDFLDQALDAEEDAEVRRQAVGLSRLAASCLGERWDDRPTMQGVLGSLRKILGPQDPQKPQSPQSPPGPQGFAIGVQAASAALAAGG